MLGKQLLQCVDYGPIKRQNVYGTHYEVDLIYTLKLAWCTRAVEFALLYTSMLHSLRMVNLQMCKPWVVKVDGINYII